MSNQLQHKLQQFEAQPPHELWAAIEERLNKPAYTFQERLLHFEEIPPAHAWENIQNALPTNKKESISLFNRNGFRYAAAAILLGIVSLGIFIFAMDQPKKIVAQLPSKQSSPIQSEAITQTPSDNNENTSINKGSSATDVQQSDALQKGLSTNTTTAATTKRYKVVAKEDGKVVRLSQKALAVFDCAVKSTASTSARCKENIQTMQAKMATAVISPAGDFAGLIDMIKTLEENK